MAHFEETAVGYKTIFQKTYNETVSEADKLATTVKSNSLTENYTWLGEFSIMKEFLDERQIEEFKDHGYAITNKLFEATVGVPLTHLEYDKIGLYKPAIEQMAQNCKQFGGDLVAQMIVDATDPVKGKCYDGKAFYAANHAMGANTYANMGAGVLDEKNLLAADAFMMSMKNAKGKNLKIRPNTLVVGPKQLSTALKLVGKENLASGESNPLYKRYDLVVLPEITDLSWHLLDLSKPLRPFIKQVAKDGDFEADNSQKFMKNKALFGAKSFMNAGYGLWQLAYRGTGVA